MACYYTVDGVFDQAALPIGKPFPNCRVCLLDEGRVITEPDTVGEIVIQSDALASGYFRGDLNHAFETRDGNVLFHTGDYAVCDASGNLVFKARRDSQVKHHGRRIELGEIAAAANTVDGLDRSCCLYDHTAARIVLFCQTRLDPEQVESHLRKLLSGYMVPEKVVVMDRLPVNANGKIDRQRLKETM